MQKEDNNAQQLRTAFNLRGISETGHIVLIPLGKLRATTHIGPAFAYLLCLQERKEEHCSGIICVSRIGLLVSKQKVEGFEAQKINIAIKHDFSSGEGTFNLD